MTDTASEKRPHPGPVTEFADDLPAVRDSLAKRAEQKVDDAPPADPMNPTGYQGII